MAASPSIELSVWQSSMHDSFTTIDPHSTIYDFDDLDGCLKWLSSNITAPFPENAFTRQLGSAHLRVLRVNSQTQTCSGLDGLLCIPTLDLSQRLGKAGNELPDDMYSSDPPTFSVPGHTSSFVYSNIVAPSTCGKLYCFDGSGYTFKADTTAALAAATRSAIFDANVRAIILTFAVYSPSLQSLYKGESASEFYLHNDFEWHASVGWHLHFSQASRAGSYLAEIAPTGSVKGTFDSFVFEYFDIKLPNTGPSQWTQVLWVLQFAVRVRVVCCLNFQYGAWR